VSASGIYTGMVVHKRLRPKRHQLRYRVFSLLLDLDELPSLSLRWLGINRPGLLSFREADHGDGGPLRSWVTARLAEAGIVADGPVRLLCYPRMLGYVFNPLTVYFCYRADGTLAAIIHEVHNTHGERHAYVLPAGEGVVRQSCSKTFFVSPFMPMDCVYHFTISPPDEQVRIGIVECDRDGVLLTATFSGERTALSDAGLLRAVFAHPLMTLKVTAAIHWEAVKLLAKGLRVYRHTPKAS
jgi:DUF1365 family protein